MPYIGNPIYQSAFVTDQFSGTGSQTTYTMSVAPAGTTNVLVIVSGVVQDPSTYGVVGNTLTFSTAPPSGTGNISCRYLGVPVTGVTTTAYRTVTEFTATASQTTFTPPSYNVGFINVYRNGVLLGSADYTATNGTTVVLATGATAGDLVTVESFLISSVANAIANAAGSVSSSNIATNAVTPAKLSTGGPYWDTSSQVGIGTTSPYSAITIGKAGGGQYIGAIDNTTGYQVGYLQFNASNITINPQGGAAGDVSVIRFLTANLERMRLDTNGFLTKPYQPMFRASRTAGHVTNNQVVVFNSVQTNIGSYYSGSTGRFTAPVAGRYQFNTHTMLVNSTSSDHQVSFRVNGSNYSTTNPGNVPNQIAMTLCEVIELAAGDYVDVYYYDSSANSVYGAGGTNWTSFSGYLLG